MLNQTYKKFKINLTEDEFKNEISDFKNQKHSNELKKFIFDNKMLLSYDDRLNTFYIFSSFQTQYAFYIDEQSDANYLVVYKVSHKPETSADLYLKELLDFFLNKNQEANII
jgi:hypothetical protein